MDPDANLIETRRRVRAILDEEDDVTRATMANGERLAELIEALDGWLSKGGALPQAWRR